MMDLWVKRAIAAHTNIYTDHKHGVEFLNIDDVIRHTPTRLSMYEEMANIVDYYGIDHVILPDARGFLFASVADSLCLSFQQARKKGKLPGDLISMPLADREYDSKNGDVLEMAKMDLSRKRVAIIDDVLATGGTALTAARMIRELKGDPVLMLSVYEIDGLDGRRVLEQENVAVESLLSLSEVKELRHKQKLPVTLTKTLVPA